MAIQSRQLLDKIPELLPNHFVYRKDQSTVILFPTLHDQVYFSKLASLLIDEYLPDLVLLELPFELEPILLKAINRLPLITVVHNGNLEKINDAFIPSRANAYIVHPGEPLFWSAYMATIQGIPIKFIDTWHEQSFSSTTIPIDAASLATIGWSHFWSNSVDYLEAHCSSNIHLYRSLHMSAQLQTSLLSTGTVMVVCGAMHWPFLDRTLNSLGYKISDNPLPEVKLPTNIPALTRNKSETWYLADIHPHSIYHVTSDLPFFLGQFVESPYDYNPLENVRQLYFEAERRYFEQFDDNISHATYQRMFQYLRNLNRLSGNLVPSFFSLITAAKGMVDDDYAFEVFKVAISYPFLPSEDEKLDTTIKFAPDEEKGEIIKLAFKRRIKRPILKKIKEDPFDIDPIPTEDYPGQWKEIWDKYSPLGMVSYPPEDVFIENYLQFLRKRIIEILMEEESSSTEFKTSLEDGIDWRTTMRKFHEKKIYVKKYPRNKYQVGALIVQFMEEPFDNEEYSHHTALFAEHDQESHISIITTPPVDVMVGPGITRVKYAALISQFPPVGFPYIIPKDNIDLKLRLIFTAMQMSLNNIIGFVANKPPTAAQRHFAAEHGYRIIYLPMGQLTKASLHRLRTMHLLAHRSLRDQAREYIGF